MLDNLNNKILNYLENHNWTVATVYWHIVGRFIPYWM